MGEINIAELIEDMIITTGVIALCTVLFLLFVLVLDFILDVVQSDYSFELPWKSQERKLICPFSDNRDFLEIAIIQYNSKRGPFRRRKGNITELSSYSNTVKKIDISGLTDGTKRIIYKRVQKPLVELYKTGSKNCPQTLEGLSPYLESLSEEFESAVVSCKGKRMERVLLERIPIITKNISLLQGKINEEVERKKLVKKMEKQLAKDVIYAPFGVTDNINQLMSNGEIENYGREKYGE